MRNQFRAAPRNQLIAASDILTREGFQCPGRKVLWGDFFGNKYSTFWSFYLDTQQMLNQCLSSCQGLDVPVPNFQLHFE